MQARVMQEFISSCDGRDGAMVHIVAPKILTTSELTDLKSLVKIWMSQLERNVDDNILTPALVGFQ